MIFHLTAATIIPGVMDTFRAVSITADSADDHPLKEKIALFLWFHVLIILKSFLGNRSWKRQRVICGIDF